MGVEGAGIWLGVPFAISILVLVAPAVTDRGHARDSRLLGMGRGRIATGYLGALCVLVVLSLWETRGDSGHAVFTVLFVIVFGPVILLLLTLIGLPLIALLRRLRFASVVGVTITGAGVAIPLGLLANEPLMHSIAIGCLLSGGFSLAGRMPMLRSPPIQANFRWSGP